MQIIVVEKMLNHTIFNKENKYRYRNKQLLLYIRGKKRVEKSKIIKTIYLRFSFLKKQIKLLVAALIEAITANIDNATIYGALSIDDYIQKQ